MLYLYIGSIIICTWVWISSSAMISSQLEQFVFRNWKNCGSQWKDSARRIILLIDEFIIGQHNAGIYLLAFVIRVAFVLGSDFAKQAIANMPWYLALDMTLIYKKVWLIYLVDNIPAQIRSMIRLDIIYDISTECYSVM